MNDRAHVFLAVSVLALLVSIGQAAAQPAPIDARVVWVRGERAYIASSDSLALGPGARLSFVHRGKPIAAGEVTRVVDREMVVASLTSGSLARLKEKDLKRLRIVSSPASAPTTLRVGYPSAKRATLFFTCALLTPASPFAGGSRTARVSDHLYRMFPPDSLLARGAWPETLEVRLFDDVADEEIALERGEVDVAVFRPGELSAHMRGQPRWQRDLSAPMSSGVVVAVREGPDDSTASIDPRDPLMTALNRELFRGDLDERRFGAISSARAAARSGVRFEVDRQWPGREVIGRFLTQRQVPPPSADAPLVCIYFVDQPVSSLRSVAEAAAERMAGRIDQGLDPSDTTHISIDFLFAIDCPVVFDARLRPHVVALGAKAFVELFDCTTATAGR